LNQTYILYINFQNHLEQGGIGGSPHLEVLWLKLFGGYILFISSGLANTKSPGFPKNKIKII
jgi:hypothetical protein